MNLCIGTPPNLTILRIMILLLLNWCIRKIQLEGSKLKKGKDANVYQCYEFFYKLKNA